MLGDWKVSVHYAFDETEGVFSNNYHASFASYAIEEAWSEARKAALSGHLGFVHDMAEPRLRIIRIEIVPIAA